jgi:abhydrolase domain-containing protein 6
MRWLVFAASLFLAMPFLPAIAFGTVLAYHLRNEMPFKAFTYARRFYFGFDVKTKKRKSGGKSGINNHQWSYMERGTRSSTRPTLVCLHGIGSNKDSWSPVVAQLPAHYHCIMLDMPGHGETTFVDDVDQLDVKQYAKSVYEFLEMKQMINESEPIRLVGISFGGGVAGIFASLYPNLVEKLVLLCPAVNTPVVTPAYAQLQAGNYKCLVPENGKDMIATLRLIADKTSYYPEKIMQTYVDLTFSLERRTLLSTLLKNLMENAARFHEEFDENLKNITMPTLILWGDNDKIIHVSGAQFLCDRLPNAQLEIFSQCNHALFMDAPLKTAQRMTNFFEQELSSKKSK